MGRKMSSWGCIPVFQFCFRGFGGSSFHLCRWGYAPITRIIYSHGVRGWANPAITEVRATHCTYVYLIVNLLRSCLPEGNRNDMCMFFFPEEVNFCMVFWISHFFWSSHGPTTGATCWACWPVPDWNETWYNIIILINFINPRLVVLAEKGGALPQKFSQLQLLPDTCTHGFQPSPR